MGEFWHEDWIYKGKGKERFKVLQFKVWSDFRNRQIQRIQYQIKFQDKTYKFITVIVMPKKCAKPHMLHHEGKENIANRHNHQLNIDPKAIHLKKQQRPQYFQKGSMDPQQLRVLCEKQEELVLAEKKSKRLDQEFFELAQNKLADSKIYGQIMKIKQMTNEEAMDQFVRIQSQNVKVCELYISYQSTNEMNTIMDDEEDSDNEILDKEVFKQVTKQVSMIEQNDDAYLEELGAQNYEMNSLRQMNEMEDEMVGQQEEISDAQYVRCQYDDIFEL